MSRYSVIALFGPTGVGKTAVAVEMAQLLRGAGEDPMAVGADALQVYAGLETLTGAASGAERARLEHRLVAFLPVSETFSAGEYAELAHAEIDALLAAGQRPIVIGGTGLYLRAALADLDLHPPVPAEVRARWERALAERGAHSLHAELAERAPSAAVRIDPGDGRRITRALELLDAEAVDPDAAGDAGRTQLWERDMRHPTLLAGLTMAREELNARIDARVDAMVAAGAQAEVEAADAAGASITARQALGFDELLAGDVEAMKLRTRRYAKRQMTWMRKLPDVATFDVTGRGAAEVAAEIFARWRAGRPARSPA